MDTQEKLKKVVEIMKKMMEYGIDSIIDSIIESTVTSSEFLRAMMEIGPIQAHQALTKSVISELMIQGKIMLVNKEGVKK